MKKYIAPELDVMKFDVEDVITTSVVVNTAPVYTKDVNVDFEAGFSFSEI